jgi:hypothetical protein
VTRSRGWRRSCADFSQVEGAQLRRLVNQAFDLRESGYLQDACDAIVEWQQRTWPDRLERQAHLHRDEEVDHGV